MTFTAPTPTPHRFAREVLGWLSLALMLALLSPGVALRAGAEAPHSALPAGPSCPAAADAQTTPLQLESWMAQVRALAQNTPGEGEVADGTMLNSRGYNYGPPPMPDPSRVAAENRLR